MSERFVLADCHSEQVRALIEEHNKLVDILSQFKLKLYGPCELPGFPRKIKPKKED